MRIMRFVAVVMIALFTTAFAFAEDAPAMPEPTPEHKELAKWVGTWAGEGEMKPGPFGPGGPMTWTEECDWFGGTEFSVVCKSHGEGPMGPSKGLGIIGYNAGSGAYTHYGVDSNGWSGYAEGKRSGDEWTFQAKEKMGDKVYHSRFKLKMASPTQMDFVWEVSEDGENWMAMMDGTSKKK